MQDLRALLNDNQFFSGGLLLGALGAALVLARQWAKKLLLWLGRQVTVSIEVRNSEPTFDWMLLWLDQQPYTKRARRVIVSVMAGRPKAPRAVGEDEKEPVRIQFSPATGNHLFRFQGRPLWLSRNREEKPAMDNNFRAMERETFTISTIGRSQAILRALVNDAYRAYLAATREETRIYTSVYEGWTPQGFVRPRSLDSVILPGTEREQLVADLQRFLASESWYHEMGIPYRRGYLLHGVPGSGKSSLVSAVASAVGMHLYVVNLASTYGDTTLLSLLQNISAPRAIVLFEDIECANAAQDREKQGTKNNRDWVTVAGLLNALDGVASRDGCVTIMTTNHRDELEPALTRPGRVDIELQFSYATPEQAVALYRRFYGEGYGDHYAGSLRAHLPAETTMADLQEHFLRHRDDPVQGASLHLIRTHRLRLRVVNENG